VSDGQRPGQEAAERPGGRRCSTPPPRADGRGPQGERGTTHRKDPPAAGEEGKDVTSLLGSGVIALI